MAVLFLDADGRDAPTCRECGSIMCRPVGSPPGTVLTCSGCGYVAGKTLRDLRAGLSAIGQGLALNHEGLSLALAEARDEGYAAGRAEALEAAAAQCDAQGLLLCDLGTDATGAQRCATAIRALAGKP